MNTHTSLHLGESDEISSSSMSHGTGSISTRIEIDGRTVLVIFGTPEQLKEIGFALMRPVSCPTAPLQANGETHTIIGCGSTNVSGPDDEGLYDCLNCGIWFNPSQEVIG